MLYKDFTTKLLGLKGLIITSLEENEAVLNIHAQTEAKEHKCPCCGYATKYVYDYRIQRIRDLRMRGKPTVILLRKRRYVCKDCGKRFLERYEFLPRYHRMTRRVYENIINSLRENYSMKAVAKQYNVSSNTVSRVFDIVNYTIYKLPTVLSFDEFKGNSGGEKYHAILTDPHKRKVLEILPTREQSHLFDYFRAKKDKSNVKFVVMDMWQPFYNVAKHCFPNAKIIVDKYHYVRQVYWALDRVRKRVQKQFAMEKRKYFKHSRKLLFAEYGKLSEESRCAVRLMLSQHDDLHTAWQLKELFIEFRCCKDSVAGRKVLREWVLTAQESGLSEFREATTAFLNWFAEILNSLDYPYTNGFTEGTNNRIKVIKRNAYGYRNFARFRNRILHCCG